MAHLSISTTREGTDPPATDVVPTANFETLGTLGWRRRGETASGDSNYKAAGTHNGTLADIGSPAWGYYGGSTNKQAALSPYSNGNSPASSAGTRGYVSTSVVGAGVRITIPLAGQSVRVRLAVGAYGGVFRIAASLSDSSAGAVTQDHTAGAVTVGWWRTTILAHATDDVTNLVIDITVTSGGFQFMGFYVDHGTPVIKSIDTTTFHEGGTSVVQIAGFASAPLTANSSLGGLAITVASATALTATLTMPAESAFRYGGTYAAKGWLRDITLLLANTTETASLTTAQIQPQYSDQYAARSGDAAANTLDTYNTDKVVVLADPVYMWTDPVEKATIDAAVVDYTPYTGDAISINGKFFDESETSWSSRTTWSFPIPDPVGGGTLEISGTQLSLSPPGTLTPGPFDLTVYGNLDWVKTARTTVATYDTKSGGTMIAAPTNYGSPVWVRSAPGEAAADPLLSWTDGAELGTYAGDRHIDYTATDYAGKRWVISPAGAAVKIYMWASTYQGTAHIDVSFSDSSATAVRYNLFSDSMVYEAELIEIIAQPVSGVATITIDLILDGGYSAGWAALAVNDGTSDRLYSLTVDDTTPNPGQTVTATLAGGPFAGAITALHLVYGAIEIERDFTVVSPSVVTFTIPAQTEFVAGGEAEELPVYASFAVRLTAGEETADSPATNQVVPVTAGDYGILGAEPWGTAHVSAQEGDIIVIVTRMGSPTNTPESSTVAGTPPVAADIYTFNVATAKWLDVVNATFFVSGTPLQSSGTITGRGRTRFRGR